MRREEKRRGEERRGEVREVERGENSGGIGEERERVEEREEERRWRVDERRE